MSPNGYRKKTIFRAWLKWSESKTLDTLQYVFLWRICFSTPSLLYKRLYINTGLTHGRIQDFVGGGGKAPSPGSAPDYCAAVNYLATQIHICEGLGGGGNAPLAPPPPLDPRLLLCFPGPSGLWKTASVYALPLTQGRGNDFFLAQAYPSP